MSDDQAPIHPGKFVKEDVLPAGMSVTAAAKLVGVSRPTLSNFLNGNSSLSAEMAARLEKAFSVNKEKLLALQQAYESPQHEEIERHIVVRTYAPAFLEISARDIEGWAEGLSARAELPALLRRLVNSTGRKVGSSKFPAGDQSQKPGWDGLVESKEATPWIPKGRSGWEFGCNKDPEKKANSDYRTRSRSTPATERNGTTFVFVTPRMWDDKNVWVQKKRAEGKWQDVRVFDAIDLEQWVETSIPTQAWLAGKLGKDTEGCFSLSDAWTRWSSLASPTIDASVFESEIASHKDKIRNWLLQDSPPPLSVTAASREEALAFVAAAARLEPDLELLNDRAVIFSSEAAVLRLRHSINHIIPVTYSGDVERAVAGVQDAGRRIVVSERRLVREGDGIFVDLPTWESFDKACRAMGLDEQQADLLRRGSGRSPTILRRLLGSSPNLRHPSWANDVAALKKMIPLFFAGTWSASSRADMEILSYLAGEPYEVVEGWVAELGAMDDAPVWSESSTRGVISVLECMNAVSKLITLEHLDRYFFVAEMVLGEDDPALDLEKDKRWAAAIFDKTRDHSRLIRNSVADTLILVAVYGQELFGNRLGQSIQHRVDDFVCRLLEGQPPRNWRSHQSDLPRYAEAAPDAFLGIIEAELKKDEPSFACLFEPADTGVMGSCDRTGMLWAIESLAWSPKYLARCVMLLGNLCTYRLEDNWVNKPAASIRDILLAWRPHTAASYEQRLGIVRQLCDRFPEVGWDFCANQISPFPSMTSGTYRPRWRGYAGGCDGNATYGELNNFRLFCLEQLLNWPEQTLATLKSLVEVFNNVPAKQRKVVENLVRDWLSKAPPPADIAELREHVRNHTLTRRARKRRGKETGASGEGRKLYKILEPGEVFDRHRWLFAKQWIDFSADEIEDDDLDYTARDEKLQKLRISALQEILSVYGAEGIRRLCAIGETAHLIGWFIGRHILSGQGLVDFAGECLERGVRDNDEPAGQCLSGLLGQFPDAGLVKFLQVLTDRLRNSADRLLLLRLFVRAPFRKVVWQLAEKHGPDFSEEYWKSAEPGWGGIADEDFDAAVHKLLASDRPRAAFDLAHFKFKSLGTETLVKLLTDIATKETEPSAHYRLQPHEIVRAFEVLNERGEATEMDLARLEQMYITVLGRHVGYKFPNLSRVVADSPMLFFQYVALRFLRKDRKDDAKELGLPTDLAILKQSIDTAYHVLENLSVIPGTNEDGTIDRAKLREWVVEVRKLSRQFDRFDVTDILLGELFHRCPPDSDGTWPCEAVRGVMEEIASPKIGEGMCLAIRNSRGVHHRPDHGGPERKLAQKYKTMAGPLMVEWPFVASILMSVAEDYEREAMYHDVQGRVDKRVRE